MENNVVTITIAIVTGLLTSLLGSIVWVYWLKHRIDHWLEVRARRRDEDEVLFQKLVEQISHSSKFEDDFTLEALAQLINNRAFWTRAYVWLGVAALLTAQLTSLVTSREVTVFVIVVFTVYALVTSVTFARQGGRSAVRGRKLWNLVIEARSKQEGRSPNPAETIDKMGRR